MTNTGKKARKATGSRAESKRQRRIVNPSRYQEKMSRRREEAAGEGEK